MVNTITYRRKRNLWLELGITTILWLLLLTLAPLGWGIDWPIEFWVKQFTFAIVLTAAYFSNSLVFVPRLLLNNRIILYALIIIGSSALILIGMRAVEHGLNLPRLMHEIFKPDQPYVLKSWFRFDFPGLLMTLLAFGVSTSIVLVRKDQRDTLVRKELEKEKVSTELSFLKAQINPHFFFNTLNNIYALTSLNVTTAQKAIHMLSAMMRYVLYDSRKELTTISQEIKFVENYIELMKLRLPEKVTINFVKPVDAPQELIAPMLLLPYVENAFKHGISSQTPSVIDVEITQQNSMLHMLVRNRIYESNGLKLEGSGIGMSNTQRRLDLIYPNKHKVEISQENGDYIVSFEIDLTA
ncbi:MAG: sensor histidine kinase [Marinoscillum sp.]